MSVQKLLFHLGIDVGGTKTLGVRCALEDDGSSVVITAESVRNAEYRGWAALAQDLMSRLGVTEGVDYTIGVAAAGVLRDEHVVVHPDYYDGELDTRCFAPYGTVATVVNDFEAQAWSLCTPTVQTAQLLLGPAEHRRNGVRTIIGPGTGLGVAALDATNRVGEELVIRSEGGHGAIPFQFQEQLPILRFMVQNPERVRHTGGMCAEALLSGEGLSLIHEFHTGVYLDPMAVGSQLTVEDLKLFALQLGLTCREKVVTFTGFDGLYLTGGVLRRTGMLDQPKVLEAFQRGLYSSVRHDAALRDMPVWLLKDENGGALGAVYAAIRAQ